jgi:hypothetical protein
MEEGEKRGKILTKFRSLAGLSLNKERVEEIIRRVDGLEQVSHMAEIVKLLN